MEQIIKLVYLMLPAYIANLLPDLCKNLIKELNFPLDFNKKFRGKPIFGSHKTFKGFVIGILGSIIVAYFQFRFSLFSQSYNIINYDSWFLIGFLQGFGALFGDAIKSFFKRRNFEQSLGI